MKCNKLLETIDLMQDKYLDILETVCNIESPTNFKEGVDEVGEYFTDMANKKGWDIEINYQKVSGNAICITLNPDSKNKSVCLSAHIDTVFKVGSFGLPCIRRDKEKMYGPGVMDCKGGAVAAFFAMDALEKVGFKSRPVKLILQSDEENSSITSNKTTIEFMCEKAKDAIAFLNLEGSLRNSAVLKRKGIIRYLFTVYGKAIHSSKCDEGANAICEAAYKIIELEKMKNIEGLTCNCGVISGGTVANTVADKCTFYADIRFSTNEELEIVKEKVKQIADDTKIEGCSCKVEEVSYRPNMIMNEQNMNLLDKMNDIYKENGLPVLTARGALGGSDASYITQCGIPCVDSIGTEGFGIHTFDEYILLKSLAESAKRIASVVYCI